MGKAKEKAKRKRTPSVYLIIDKDSVAHFAPDRKAVSAAIHVVGPDEVDRIYRAVPLRFELEKKVRVKLSAWSLDD